VDELAIAVLPLVEDDLSRSLTGPERKVLESVVPLVQERIKHLTDVPDQVRFLFTDDLTYDAAAWNKVMGYGSGEVLAAAAGALAGVDGWATVAIEGALRAMLEELSLSASKGLQPLRIAITGSSVSPPLFESMEALGRDRTLARLEAARLRL
jgi:glutamyl-tRNA synthetase